MYVVEQRLGEEGGGGGGGQKEPETIAALSSTKVAST